ncbi:hypothetical protein CAOG_00739 [Capsaspora owczarzaki ATCC 30864]|uniref:Glutamine amidotransferase domain-containing protein n=1 Tax=Capsaspora owczarzaki (strain ATCC 30864) TaxID=595528 RepID=A0A0D2WHS7_CAPO3|nr:hypothetical protein CAOG_00739 [Capsaspora owczarzaki ATCC 30864]KJE89225.1 hypothetical protein CAOG_000739 [Capsaspora owczarzaki ATCC 30864]|eukprot:XP_004365610.1 hypothetical protein CAOG_00739 [Capsaspora owczarzaki ATCC 30864]
MSAVPSAGVLLVRAAPATDASTSEREDGTRLQVLLHATTRGDKHTQRLLSDLGGRAEASDWNALFCAARELSEETCGIFSPLETQTDSLAARILSATQQAYWLMASIDAEVNLASVHPQSDYHCYLAWTSNNLDVNELNVLSRTHENGKRLFVWVDVAEICAAITNQSKISLVVPDHEEPLELGLHPRISTPRLAAALHQLGRDSAALRSAALSSSALRTLQGRVQDVSLPPRRFAVIDTEDDPVWSGHEWLWRLHLEEFAGLRGHVATSSSSESSTDTQSSGAAAEEWSVYRAFAGELPADDGRHLAGIIITGSHHSTNDTSQAWIASLSEFIRRCSAHGQTQIFASCFGCQCTAAALGGAVTTNPSGQYVFQTESVKVQPAAKDSAVGALFQAVQPEGGFRVLESHGECVATVPPGSEIVCASDSARVEVFAFNGCLPQQSSVVSRYGNVLGIQSHPEFSVQIMERWILPSLEAEGATLSVPTADGAFRRSVRQARDGRSMLSAIRSFLKSAPK